MAVPHGNYTSQRVMFRRNLLLASGCSGEFPAYIDHIVLQIVESTDNQVVSFRSGGWIIWRWLPEVLG